MENNISYVITRAPCSVERTIGALLSILLVVSLLANLTLIYTILKHTKLRTTINYLNVCLALVNLYGILTELPLMIVNNFNCSFIFGRAVCLYMGFTLFSNICAAMYTLTLISIERYLVICQPFKNFSFNTKRYLISMSTLLVVVLILAMIPLVGWSEYTIDYGHFSCWISEQISKADKLSFFMFFFTFVYGLCFFLLIFTNVNSILTVKKASKKFENDRISKKKLKKETHLMKVSIVSIASFALSYTPYLILAFIRFATGYSEHSFYIITVFLARCSLLWPPVVILLMNKDIKPFVFNTERVHHHHQTTTGTA